VGRKVFTREVLSSADVNDYLMDQSIMRFTSAAQRSTQIPTPEEGMISYLEDTDRWYGYRNGAWQLILIAPTLVLRQALPSVTVQPAGGAINVYAGAVTIPAHRPGVLRLVLSGGWQSNTNAAGFLTMYQGPNASLTGAVAVDGTETRVHNNGSGSPPAPFTIEQHVPTDGSSRQLILAARADAAGGYVQPANVYGTVTLF
jgi:hypothetical protein